MNREKFKKWFFTDNFYWVNKDNYKDLQEIALEMGCLCHTGTKEIIEWHRGFKALGFRSNPDGKIIFQEEKSPKPSEAPSSYDEMKRYYRSWVKPIEKETLSLAKKIEPKPLFLVLERIYFNQILEGTKDVEYRMDKPFYRSRLIRNSEYRNFKTVVFQEGYHKQARKMTVRIKQIILVDDIFEIHLGEIIGRNF